MKKRKKKTEIFGIRCYIVGSRTRADMLTKHLLEMMDMMTVNFKFELRQKVKIKEINRPGVITQLLVTCHGHEYQVAYWESAKRETAWVLADELEAI